MGLALAYSADPAAESTRRGGSAIIRPCNCSAVTATSIGIRQSGADAVVRSQAGWENDITAGVDWYINPKVHFIVNYVYTHLTYVNKTSGDINGLGCRLHLNFDRALPQDLSQIRRSGNLTDCQVGSEPLVLIRFELPFGLCNGKQLGKLTADCLSALSCPGSKPWSGLPLWAENHLDDGEFRLRYDCLLPFDPSTIAQSAGFSLVRTDNPYGHCPSALVLDGPSTGFVMHPYSFSTNQAGTVSRVVMPFMARATASGFVARRRASVPVISFCRDRPGVGRKAACRYRG